jgi:predicted nuclease of predicted toxin-antitoxin system
VEKARQEERIILTFDLDFGDILAASSYPLPSVIIFRLKNTLPPFLSARFLVVLSECSEDLETGAIVMVEDSRYRLRRLPI